MIYPQQKLTTKYQSDHSVSNFLVDLARNNRNIFLLSETD